MKKNYTKNEAEHFELRVRISPKREAFREQNHKANLKYFAETKLNCTLD